MVHTEAYLHQPMEGNGGSAAVAEPVGFDRAD